MATNKNKIPKDAAVIIGQYLLDSNQNHFVSLKKEQGWETWEKETDTLYSGLHPAIWCADAVRIDVISDDKHLTMLRPDQICEIYDTFKRV